MTDITQVLLAKYSAKSSERSIENDTFQQDQLLSYRQAAALLHCFQPDLLKPLSNEHLHKKPFTLLHDDIVGFSGGFADGLYTLKPEIRREALKTFASRKLMAQGLLANPNRMQTHLQQLWEDYLNTGVFPIADELQYRQLIDLYQVVNWVEGIEQDLPDANILLGLIKRKSVLANFEHLVISNFTGRVEELELLRAHIEGSAESSKPVLSIFGSGGIGKSALIGKILYESATAQEDKRLPYIYLAFDLPSLRIENPVTILSEAASQLELQYPKIAGRVEEFKNYIRYYGTELAGHGTRGIISTSRQERISVNAKSNEMLFKEFADLLTTVREISSGSNKLKNILLTFDTFEEVQYRDRESLDPFWNMLAIITKWFPYLRILIAGRTPITNTPYPTSLLDEISLGGLKMTDRKSLLVRLGIINKSIAQLVAERVGGNPLSLRLAARVITDEQDTGNLNDTIPENWLLFKMDEQLIQGQIYKRVLNHIHNEDVRKLAHPGMVLRKVTPELILTVLAPICDIQVNGPAMAQELFALLEQEHSLVQLGEFGTLKYRPEIRQVMVRLLQQDKFEEVRSLHENAIDFYYDKAGTEARAEELYHRLALGVDETDVLDKRWVNGIEQSVSSTLDEYSDRMKAWLASKTSLEVPREVFQNANVIEWERNITRKVKKALLNMDMPRTFELLHERTERSLSSPLFAIEAKANLIYNQADRADQVIDEGIKKVSQSTNRGRLAELFWLKSQIAVMKNDILEANQCLQEAQLAIQHASNPVTLIHILCQRLLLLKTYPEYFVEADEILRSELSTACLRLNKNQKYVPEFIILLAVGFLGGEYPKTIDRLQDYYSVFENDNNSVAGEEKNMLVNENLRGLEKFREVWEGGDDDDESRHLEQNYQSFA